MKVLITGAGGFVGRHLAAELAAAGMDLILTSDVPGSLSVPGHGDFQILQSDISDIHSLKSIFQKERPDAVVHLAAVSHVVNAENNLEKLSEINVIGTHNVCSAASSLKKPLTFLFVSSSLVYGGQNHGSGSTSHFDEHTPTAPDSAYGASKLAGEATVLLFTSDHFKPYIVRPFNHIGPGQHPNFVCPGLAQKIANAKDGDTISVGNLHTMRDFSDVRDVVRAYRMILEQAPSERLFVIGSGRTQKIDEIFKQLVAISGKHLETAIDPTLVRTVDPISLCSNAALARKTLNWAPKIELTRTLKDIYAAFNTGANSNL